ncbi:hypothetical protein [Candidatus Nitrosocosmicus franklandus]|uniref:Uncharacterized protein n=1 Tax=Candidatus Nitrosocosmicus franklandianus TaxID=1798806 RepID=A0A484I7I5_9ARCH|nr:hypothetical protein [Candidatus Nitrosocosmicus franklandus]VFJ12710.1 protein of unknown function [Candidatus Nitrosocosmicus franklandus]
MTLLIALILAIDSEYVAFARSPQVITPVSPSTEISASIEAVILELPGLILSPNVTPPFL